MEKRDYIAPELKMVTTDELMAGDTWDLFSTTGDGFEEQTNEVYFDAEEDTGLPSINVWE